MDNNASYTLVGAFVVFLIAAIVFAIIWLSAGLSSLDYKNYLIYSEESVSGLSIDAPVEYNGVNVGEVRDITLDKNNPHLVRVLLKINSATPITQGTVATLTSRGVTGVAFIALKDVGTNLQPIALQPGQPYPIIPTRPSIFMRLDTALTALNKSFQTVSNTFAALLDKENLKSIKGILGNLDKLTVTLSDNTEKLNTLMLNTSLASKQLTPLLTYSNNAMKTIELQTLPAANDLILNLNNTIHMLKDTAVEIKQHPSILLRGTSPPPLGPGEGK